MTRRTVLHLIHTGGAGGAETVLLQLVEGLDPTAWRSIAGVPPGGWLWGAACESRAETVPMPNSGAFDLGQIRRIIRTAKSGRVDLIHAHLFGSTLYGTIAARMLALPLVSTLHGSVDLAAARRWGGLKIRLLRRPENQFVAVTDALREEVVNVLGIPSESVRVIANGVDVSRFFPARSRALRRELGWDGDEIVVGAVGNVRRPKGYHYLLEAASLMRDRWPRCRFVILGDTTGDPPLYRALIRARSARGLDDVVVFGGFRANIAECLNNLDVFVLSSTTEGLPLAVLQAMAVRLPIVATKCGGPQEVLTDGMDALLVPTHDARSLAEAIEALVADAGLMGRLATAAFETVNARYSLAHTTSRYAELYEDTLRTPAAGAV